MWQSRHHAQHLAGVPGSLAAEFTARSASSCGSKAAGRGLPPGPALGADGRVGRKRLLCGWTRVLPCQTTVHPLLFSGKGK